MPSWNTSLSDPAFRKKFLVTLFFFGATLTGFTFFLAYAEGREGYRIPDPLMALVPKTELSMLIFSLTYSATLAGIILCARHPRTLLLALQTYTLMTILRMLCMFLLPLEPPADTLHLDDPFLTHTFYMGRPNLKDLFFSGHTATVFLFGLVLETRFAKFFFFTAAAVVGACVIAQHVHYTIDVIAAPVMTLLAFWLARNYLSDRKIS